MRSQFTLPGSPRGGQALTTWPMKVLRITAKACKGHVRASCFACICFLNCLSIAVYCRKTLDGCTYTNDTIQIGLAGEMFGFRKAAEVIAKTLTADFEGKIAEASPWNEAIDASDEESDDTRETGAGEPLATKVHPLFLLNCTSFDCCPLRMYGALS